jgi:uncharacterized protein YlxW (UPF0749 family)
MSTQAELHLLHTRIAELESTVQIIDKGHKRQEDKLRDRLACAFVIAGALPVDVYGLADQVLKHRGPP